MLVSGIDVITAALAAGAGAGLTSTASAAVQDAYAQLKAVLVDRLGGRRQARDVLTGDLIDPADWRAAIGADLLATGSAEDERVIALAERVLALVEQQPPRIDLRHSRGVQIGDHGTQTNTFH